MSAKKETLLLNEDGMLESPVLHDAEIESINIITLNRERNASARLRTVDNKKYEIKFMNPYHVVCRDIFPQNVVFDISIYKEKLLAERIEEFHDEFEWLSKLSQEADINITDCCLVNVSPSVGIELIVLCADVEVFRV